MPYSSNQPLAAMFDQRPLERAARRITDRVGDMLKDRVEHRTPVAAIPPGVGAEAFQTMRGGRKPGSLKRSWRETDVDHGKTPEGEDRYGVEVYTEDPLAPLVEYPTRPHLIKPRLDRAPASVRETAQPRRGGADPKAALRFVNARGQVVYAHEVHHPGTQGVYMMRDSLAEVDGTWVTQVGAREVEVWAKEQLR